MPQFILSAKILLSKPSTIRELTANQCKKEYNLTIVWTHVLSVIHLKCVRTYQHQRSDLISYIVINSALSYTDIHQIMQTCNSNNHLRFFTVDTKRTVFVSESNWGQRSRTSRRWAESQPSKLFFELISLIKTSLSYKDSHKIVDNQQSTLSLALEDS